MRRLYLLAALLAVVAAGCTLGGSQPDGPPAASATTQVEGPLGIGDTASPGGEPDVRLGSHLILQVGDRRPLEGLGTLVEVLELTGSAPIRMEEDELVATGSGIVCLRYRYRETERENDIQTLCVVVVNDVGSCAGLPPVELDLERFLIPDGQPSGNANLLSSGEGLFYRICRPSDDTLRLETSARPLPPLYLVVVDALTEGSYALGDTEMDAQRAGVVTTFDGAELAPPWLITVSREITALEIGEDGSVGFNDNDCVVAPSCTYRADAVAEGDLLRISFGLDPGAFEETLFALPPSVRDRFFTDRIGMTWADLEALPTEAQVSAFARLVSLDVMGDLLEYFDGIHDLRARGIRIGYWPYWRATYPVTQDCLPEVMARCGAVESAVADAERAAIDGWRAAGFRLWWAGLVSYLEDGAYAPFSDRRPDVTLFDGVVATLVVTDAYPVADVPGTLRNVVAGLASELGPDRPVILALPGPPITSTTQGVFCEADICPSDFEAAFRQGEAILDQALISLSVDQFQGFGVALFDGSGFDIRQPYEDYGDFQLNRAGETGYNSPVLNIWRVTRWP